MNRLVRIALLSAILAASGWPIAAQESDSSQRRGKEPEPFDVTVMANEIRLVTGDDFPPFAGQDLPEGGMITELLTTALSKSDVQFDLDYENWVRGRVLTLYALYDATFPYARTLERDALFYFSKPLFTAEVRWYLASDSPVDEIDSDGLQGKRVCKPDGYYLSDIQQYLITRTIELDFAPTMKACLKRLQDGDADLVSGSRLVIEGTIASSEGLEPDSFKSLPSEAESTFHVMVSKFNPLGFSIISRINDAIDALPESEREAIRERHLAGYSND